MAVVPVEVAPIWTAPTRLNGHRGLLDSIVFTKTDNAGESRGQWYLRQMLGSANFDAGPTLAFMSGNLCYQIEHHLYPDLPSNRLHEIAVRVRAICDNYDLPYTTGSFLLQYGKTWRTVPVKDCEGCPARAGVRNLEADDPRGGRPALHCNFCESDHSIEPAPRRLLPRRVRRPRRGRRHRGRVRMPQSISSTCSRCSTTRRWRRSSRGRTR